MNFFIYLCSDIHLYIFAFEKVYKTHMQEEIKKLKVETFDSSICRIC